MTDVAPGHPSAGWRRPGPWFLAAAVLAAVAMPGGLAAAHLVRVAPTVGYAHPLATSATFSVDLTDAPSFSPRILNVTGNGSVSIVINLDNTGSLDHTFTVVNASQSGVFLNRSWTPERLDRYFAQNGSLANVNLTGGSAGSASIALPASNSVRSFEFVSTVPYQFQSGMWGFLNVTPVGPTYSVDENTTSVPSFVPNVLSTPTGAKITGPVSFDVLVTNLGSVPHTFTVSDQANTTLTSTGSLKSHPPLANVTVPAVLGGTVLAKFTVPGIGVYEYVCTIAGHFAAGMFGFLYVGVPVPPRAAAPSTAIVAVPVLVGSGVLLGVGLALALGSAYVGRLPKKPGSHDGHP